MPTVSIGHSGQVNQLCPNFFLSGNLVGHSGHVNSLYTKMDTGGMLFHCIQMDTADTLTSCVLIFFIQEFGWTQQAC